jgi:alpha-tubulin suppressor-like RCC1 family protein
MSYVDIGTSNPNHELEVNGQIFISNVEQGSATNLVPFEIYSDYTGKQTLTDSRQLRLRVTPSSTTDIYHADMGMDNVNGNVFFISNPVTGTTSGDRDVFNIKDDGNVYISHLDVNSLTVVDFTFTSVTLGELSVTGTITASNIVGGSPLTLSSDSNVQVNTELILNNDLQVGGTITVGDGRTVTIKEISGGQGYTVLVDTEGMLWGTGRKLFLGVNSSSGSYTTFTQIPTDVLVANVACGSAQTMIIDINGTVSGTGDNGSGQLGIGVRGGTYTTFTSNATPVTASQIACGEYHTMIIDTNNTVWGTGYNQTGELGIGNFNDTNVFTSNATPVTASQIAGGGLHTMIIDTNGTVSGTGVSAFGALGISDRATQQTFTSTSVTASQIACGYQHTIIMNTNGLVAVTGRNWDGELGLGDNATRQTFTPAAVTASQIACGSNYTMIIDRNGKVSGTGKNDNGQLGLGDTTDRNVFTSTSVTASQIACCPYHTLITGTDGTVSGTGYNDSGQLGIGNTSSQTTFASSNKGDRQTSTRINKTDIHLGDYEIGYYINKLKLGFPGYYTTIDTDGNMTVTGNISKGPGGTFNIPHPLPSMEDSHRLLHSFIEGPKMDLVYRGLATLTNGFASVDIDEASNMTQGTFQALTRDVQCFTTNETNWEKVKGKIKDNKLSIQSNNPVSNIEVNWLIMGERNDDHIKKSIITDDEGNLIVEPLKGII